eukprot:tig00000769_g4036.t1
MASWWSAATLRRQASAGCSSICSRIGSGIKKTSASVSAVGSAFGQAVYNLQTDLSCQWERLSQYDPSWGVRPKIPASIKDLDLRGPVYNLIRITAPLSPTTRQSTVAAVSHSPEPESLAERAASPKAYVLLCKRPLDLGFWTHILPLIYLEHVGVKIVLPSACGKAEEAVVLDFVPQAGGDTEKFRGQTAAMIQENRLHPVDWAFVGTTDKTLQEIQEFNRSYEATYWLGANDCRDYASALVKFLTGKEIDPGMLTYVIESNKGNSVHLQPPVSRLQAILQSEPVSGLMSSYAGKIRQLSTLPDQVRRILGRDQEVF